MKCNLGKTDRIVRGIIGVAIIAIGVYYQSWWGAIGVLPLLTAFVGFCSLYTPLKLSTIKIHDVNKK
jgi:hypothetical protein